MSRLNTIAAVFIFISTLLHFAAPLLTGFNAEATPLLIFGVLYAVLGWLVLKNKRWAKWISFFTLLFFGIAAMASYFGSSTIPGWVNLGIWLADWAAAICLFFVLWRDHSATVIQEAKQAS